MLRLADPGARVPRNQRRHTDESNVVFGSDVAGELRAVRTSQSPSGGDLPIDARLCGSTGMQQPEDLRVDFKQWNRRRWRNDLEFQLLTWLLEW